MGTRTVTAVFSSRAQAELAQGRLRELGIGADTIQISDSGEKTSAGRAARLMITGVVDANVNEVTSLLERLNAMQVEPREEEWPQPGRDWMGHHQGRVTGTKVPAGQGDAETGPPLPPEADDEARGDHSEA